MKKIFQSIPYLLLTFLATGGFGRQNTDRRELRWDKREIAASSVSVADDRRDYDRLSDLVMRWDGLRRGGESTEFQEVQKTIAEELRRDLRESAVETVQAKREVSESAAERNAGRRELRRERKDGDGDRRALADDRRDLRRERHDLRDDERDAKQAEELFRKKKDVARGLIAVQKQIDSPGKAGDKALQKQQLVLLEDYLKVSREEIKAGIREKAEDRKELRDDRRERREDRRD